MTVSDGQAPVRRESFGYRGLQYRFLPRYRVIWCATALLVVVCLVLEPNTFSAPSLKIETPLIAVLGIASIGQLLVVTVGGFDLSVAATMTFASALLLKVTQGSDDRLILALCITLLACAVIGASNGLLASFGLNPLVVTLAMGGIASAVTLLITNGGADVTAYNIPNTLATFAADYVGSVSTMLFVAVALLVVVAILVRSTRGGRRLVAAGTNPAAARVVGIRVRGYQVAAYAFAGLLYGVAGVLLAAFVQHPDVNLGSPYLLSTFIVVALGGALLGGGPNSLLSAAAGAAFLIFLNQFLAIKGLSPGDQSLIQGVVLIVAVAAVTAARAGALGRRVPWPLSWRRAQADHTPST
jgi:ribose transport system permease protein